MGQPDWIRILSYHEIGGITTLSLRENGIVGSVPRDYQRLCETIKRTS